MRVRFALLCAVLAMLPRLAGAQDSAFALHLVFGDETSGARKVEYKDGEVMRELYLTKTPVLTLKDFKTATAQEGDDGKAEVAIELTPSGAEQLANFTASIPGEMAAVLVEGEVVSVFVIKEQNTSGSILIPGLTMADARELTERLNRAAKKQSQSAKP